MSTVGERRCRARNKHGEQCRGTVIGSDGLCHVHSAGVDMRQLGKAGARARRERRLSLGDSDQRGRFRAELQRIDPAVVRAGVEEALASDSQTAKVSAIRLLSDLETFRRDDECPRCAAFEAEMALQADAARAKLADLVEQRARGLLLAAATAAELDDGSRPRSSA